jgi:chemotaxis protein histidine kinase CheA
VNIKLFLDKVLAKIKNPEITILDQSNITVNQIINRAKNIFKIRNLFKVKKFFLKILAVNLAVLFMASIIRVDTTGMIVETNNDSKEKVSAEDFEEKIKIFSKQIEFREQIESAAENIEKIKRIIESNSELLPDFNDYLKNIKLVVLLENFDINRIDVLKNNILKILLILEGIFNRFKQEIEYRECRYGLEHLLENFSNYSYNESKKIIYFLLAQVEAIIKNLISEFKEAKNLEEFFSLLSCLEFNYFYLIFYQIIAKLNEAEEEALIKDFNEIIEKSRKAEENKTEEAKKAEKEERIKKIEETNKCIEEADAEIEKINKEIKEAQERIEKSNKKVDIIKENGEKNTIKELNKIKQALKKIKEIFSMYNEKISNSSIKYGIFNLIENKKNFNLNNKIFDFNENRKNFNLNKIKVIKILSDYHCFLTYISENFCILEAVDNKLLEELNHKEPFRRFYMISKQIFEAIIQNMCLFLDDTMEIRLLNKIYFIPNCNYDE